MGSNTVPKVDTAFEKCERTSVSDAARGGGKLVKGSEAGDR